MPDTTVSLHGVGVTIDLTFPKEAHPGESIWHNATLKANTALTLYNLTLVIKAPVNSIWQEATSWSLSNRVISENAVLTEEMNFQLSSNVNGTLQCFIYVNTTQGIDYLSTTLFTTHVSELTFSEMQSLYDEMLANYTGLQEDYATLLNTYNDLMVNYSVLLDNYTALLSEYDTLSDQYGAQVTSYQDLLRDYNNNLDEYSALDNNYKTLDGNYRSKISEFSNLQEIYDELNTNYTSLQGNFTNLQGNFTSLQTIYDSLNRAYSDLQTSSESALDIDRVVMFIFIVAVAALVAFIVYIKWKKQEPYVVIRKETVSMSQDESPEEPS